MLMLLNKIRQAGREVYASDLQRKMAMDILMFWIYVLLAITTGVTPENEDMLYFSDLRRHSLFRMPLAGGTHTRIPIPNLVKPIGVAYDDSTDTVFATERGTNAANSHKFIARYRFTSGDSRRFELRRSSILDGLVVDPISQLLFYSDAKGNYIGVLTTDLLYHSIIINEGLDKPRALAVDPLEGKIYWTDWSDNFPHIGQAYMDGSQNIKIVSSGLGWPNGIFLDQTGSEKYLYWADAKLDKVERSNTDGSNRQVILQAQNIHFFGIVLDETYIYLTDWVYNAIRKMPKDGSSSPQNLGAMYPVNSTRMNGLAIGKMSLKISGENGCSRNTSTGVCAHICLPTGPTSRVCQCTEGFFLLSDGTTCQRLPLVHGLVVADITKQDLLVVDLDKNSAFRVPVYGHMAVRDVAYDQGADKMFWTDEQHQFVATTCVLRQCVSYAIHQVTLPGSRPEGIALSRADKRVYFVDSGLGTITSMDYKGSQVRLLISTELQSPRSIALDPVRRIMYWTNWGSGPRIEKANMDNGGGRVDFVNTNLTMPNYLAIDLTGQRLFWTEGSYGRLEMIQLDGTGRQTVYEQAYKQYLGLTYGQNTLYWSEIRVRGFYSIDLATKRVTHHQDSYLDDIHGLDFFGEGMTIAKTTQSSLGPPNSDNSYPDTTVAIQGETTISFSYTNQNTTNPSPGPTNSATKSLPSPVPVSNSGGMDRTLIIALTVSIGGVVIILIIGVICYKRLDAHISAVSQAPAPAPTPLKLFGEEAGYLQPKEIDDNPYSEVLDYSPPTDVVRPPAPLPQPHLPEVPPTEVTAHPYLGLPSATGHQPDLIPSPSRSPPPLPRSTGASTREYVDRPAGTPTYAGLLMETRDTTPPNKEYTRFNNAE